MMRSANWIAIFIALGVILVGYSLFAPSSLPKLWQMRHKETVLKDEIASLEKKIAKQKKTIRLLQGNSRESNDFLEYLARKEHGLVGPGELLLFLKQPKGK